MKKLIPFLIAASLILTIAYFIKAPVEPKEAHAWPAGLMMATATVSGSAAAGCTYSEQFYLDGGDWVKLVTYQCIILGHCYAVTTLPKIKQNIIWLASTKGDFRSRSDIISDWTAQKNRAKRVTLNPFRPLISVMETIVDDWVHLCYMYSDSTTCEISYVCDSFPLYGDMVELVKPENNLGEVNHIKFDESIFDGLSPKEKRSKAWHMYETLCKLFKIDLVLKYPAGTTEQYVRLIREIIQRDELSLR